MWPEWLVEEVPYLLVASTRSLTLSRLAPNWDSPASFSGCEVVEEQEEEEEERTLLVQQARLFEKEW